MSLNICFLELSEEFLRDKNEFELTMVNEPSVFELLRFNCVRKEINGQTWASITGRLK